MHQLTVDFPQIIGKIKPMHGICNAPLCGTDNKLFHYLGKAGIPFSRLHDTGGRYGGGCFVDINNIFRDFEADPADPAAYDFAFTDWLLDQLHKQGVEPFYRLGTTIENSHQIKAYYIYPPKDYQKWAKICEGIIRHYNEGWADGFFYNIRYWEIWNEPDNEPEIDANPMWKGTKEEYYQLYETTACYLKTKFPSIKIGGYGSCGFYALNQIDVSETAHSSARVDYFLTFFEEFLQYLSSCKQKIPFDFFSWHSYAGAADNQRYAAYVREKLDSYGFTETESILNEWNPGIEHRGTAKDAARIAAMMCAMEQSSVDCCIYYDGQVHSSYGGLFDPVHLTVFKAYDAFCAFQQLYQLKNEVHCTVSGGTLHACAASDGCTNAVLIANPTDNDFELDCCFRFSLESKKGELFVYISDEKHDFGGEPTTLCLSADGTGRLSIGANSVVLLRNSRK